MLEKFKEVGELLFAEGLIDSFGGNLSIRSGEKIIITSREARLGTLVAEDLIEVGLTEGENDAQASRELIIHRAIYQKTNALAIVHAHSAQAIALSLTDNKIVPQDAGGNFVFRSAAIVRARDGIGSADAARMLPSFLNGDNRIAVVKGHGSYAIGQCLLEAYKYTSALENSCKVIVAVRASGGRKPQQQQSSQQSPQRRERRGPKSAIPPGIGVMGRSRFRSR